MADQKRNLDKEWTSYDDEWDNIPEVSSGFGEKGVQEFEPIHITPKSKPEDIAARYGQMGQDYSDYVKRGAGAAIGAFTSGLIPFKKEIRSGVESAFGDKTYAETLAEYQNIARKEQQEWPRLTFGSTLVGSGVGSALGMGALGKAAQAVPYLANLGKAGKFALELGKGAAVSGVQGASEAGEGSMGEGAATGAALSVGGDLLFAGAGKALRLAMPYLSGIKKSIFDAFAERGAEIAGARSKEVINEITQNYVATMEKVQEAILKESTSSSEAADSLYKEAINQRQAAIDAAQSAFDEMAKNADIAGKEFEMARNSFMNELDKRISEKTEEAISTIQGVRPQIKGLSQAESSSAWESLLKSGESVSRSDLAAAVEANWGSLPTYINEAGEEVVRKEFQGIARLRNRYMDYIDQLPDRVSSKDAKQLMDGLKIDLGKEAASSPLGKAVSPLAGEKKQIRAGIRGELEGLDPGFDIGQAKAARAAEAHKLAALPPDQLRTIVENYTKRGYWDAEDILKKIDEAAQGGGDLLSGEVKQGPVMRKAEELKAIQDQLDAINADVSKIAIPEYGKKEAADAAAAEAKAALAKAKAVPEPVKPTPYTPDLQKIPVKAGKIPSKIQDYVDIIKKNIETGLPFDLKESQKIKVMDEIFNFIKAPELSQELKDAAMNELVENATVKSGAVNLIKRSASRGLAAAAVGTGAGIYSGSAPIGIFTALILGAGSTAGPHLGRFYLRSLYTSPKYARLIENAIKGGIKATTLHYILSKENPDYAKFLDQEFNQQGANQ